MLRVADGRVSVTDKEGRPADAAFAEVIEIAEPALRTRDALIDGIWTNMPFIGAGSAARHLADAIAEEGLTDELPDPIRNEQRHALVALDLVELDGQPLHHVPFQERRRLLTAVIEEGIRVRLSPAVRHPIHNWLSAWRANGFAEYLAKHANSRYAPGEVAEDWLRLSTAAPRGPNPMTRLFMPTRDRPVPRIGDRQKKG